VVGKFLLAPLFRLVGGPDSANSSWRRRCWSRSHRVVAAAAGLSMALGAFMPAC